MKTKIRNLAVSLSFVGAALGAVTTNSTVMADTSGAVKHPIVLVHGLSGFDSVLGDYFYGVKSELNGVGASQVFTPQVTGWDSDEARGEELLAYVEDVLAATGASKVNLMGHSQGGTTSRYVAAVRPDLVASVTSIGSPHYGSKVGNLFNDSVLEGPAVAIGNAIGSMIALLSGDSSQESNAIGAIEALNEAGAAEYTAKYPQGVRSGSCKDTPSYNAGRWWWPNWVKDYSVNDGQHQVNGVRYYSWSGTYNGVFDSNVLDPLDGVLALANVLHSGEENDGLVERCSSHMGDVIRDDYTLNHGDEINGFFGLRGLWSSAPLPIYSAQARRLKSAGL